MIRRYCDRCGTEADIEEFTYGVWALDGWAIAARPYEVPGQRDVTFCRVCQSEIVRGGEYMDAADVVRRS